MKLFWAILEQSIHDRRTKRIGCRNTDFVWLTESSTPLFEKLLSNKNSIMKTEPKVWVGSRMQFYPSEIIFLKSDINYTKIFLANGETHLVSTNLGKLEPRFLSFNFFRLNRSFIVNLTHVLVAQKDEQLLVQLPNEKQVCISRRRKEQFLKTLN